MRSPRSLVNKKSAAPKYTPTATLIIITIAVSLTTSPLVGHVTFSSSLLTSPRNPNISFRILPQARRDCKAELKLEDLPQME